MANSAWKQAGGIKKLDEQTGLRAKTGVFPASPSKVSSDYNKA